MLIEPPAVVTRDAVPYIAVRRRVSVNELDQGVVAEALDTVTRWLMGRDLTPSAPPIVRYCIVDGEGVLELEIGWPVDEKLATEGDLVVGTLPAGRYATLTYEGMDQGEAAHRALLDWAAAQGLTWQSERTAAGQRLAARVEHLLTAVDDDDAPARYQTEVAMLLAP